jgi:hypothetical protein
MDLEKRRQLIESLSSESEGQIVSVDRFFDGNDDIGSIGCNLIHHPGVDAFRDVFKALEDRPDLEAVYVGITELDPGEGCWPFSDTVFVVGTISTDELRAVVQPLQPDEVGPGAYFKVPAAIRDRHQGPILGVWWD